jgi:thioredoxin reductase (NADPH)
MHAAICASGVEYRRLNLWNEERLRGASVYYGASTSEAELSSSTVALPGHGRSIANPTIWKPAFPECSP